VDWMKALRDDSMGWVSGALLGLGGLWLKFRASRGSELERLVELLQTECNVKGIQIVELNVLVVRLRDISNHQRLEIFLHNRSRQETMSDLHHALASVRRNEDDCEAQIQRAIARLSEDIIVPDQVIHPEAEE